MKNSIKVLSVFSLVSVILLSCELFGDKSLPDVSITAPDDNSSYTTADLITFTGVATDMEDLALTGNSLTWVSSIDDTLGNGEQVNTYLSAGEHLITLYALDAEGNQDSDAINVNITTSSASPKLENDYSGFLHVRYTNTVPEWDVETAMAVNIVGDSGVIHIETGLLSYSGETLTSAESKITRDGEWAMQPSGVLKGSGITMSIEVDGGITVQNDVQRIWALSGGSWVQVNETTFNETPSADLIFSLNEALSVGGSQFGASLSTGSIMWTLTLIEE